MNSYFSSGAVKFENPFHRRVLWYSNVLTRVGKRPCSAKVSRSLSLKAVPLLRRYADTPTLQSVLRRTGPGSFEKEPGPSLRLVDPIFNQTGCSDIVMLITNVMRFSQSGSERFVIFAQLSNHIQWLDVSSVVVRDSRHLGDLPHGSQCHTADLANPFRDVISHRKELLSLFVQQQMVVTKMGTTHMPVEVFCLDIECKNIGEDRIHRSLDVFSSGRRQISGSDQRSFKLSEYSLRFVGFHIDTIKPDSYRYRA